MAEAELARQRVAQRAAQGGPDSSRDVRVERAGFDQIPERGRQALGVGERLNVVPVQGADPGRRPARFSQGPDARQYPASLRGQARASAPIRPGVSVTA